MVRDIYEVTINLVDRLSFPSLLLSSVHDMDWRVNCTGRHLPAGFTVVPQAFPFHAASKVAFHSAIIVFLVSSGR